MWIIVWLSILFWLMIETQTNTSEFQRVSNVQSHMEQSIFLKLPNWEPEILAYKKKQYFKISLTDFFNSKQREKIHFPLSLFITK